MIEIPDNNTLKFIREHADDDIKLIALKAAKTKSVNATLAIRQIAGRQKVKNKIPEFYNIDKLIYPPGISLEQCSSSQTARYKSSLFHGHSFMDMTGGFAVDFYFMSKSFEKGIYIEQNQMLCEIAEFNFKELQIGNCTIYNAKCEDVVDQISTVDLIYLDPHRRDDLGRKKVFIADCEPNVTVLLDSLFKISPNILIKLSPMLDISQAIQDLNYVTEVHVVAVENECKEILFILSADNTGEIEIKTVNFKKNLTQKFDFKYHKEDEQIINYTDEVSEYIYEPNAAIMKSGAFKSIASRFNLQKFHPNTHIYTTSELILDFPGRIFRLKRILSDEANLKQLKKVIPVANISLRNYKMSVEDFRKKTGIKEGGNSYLFGFRNIKNNYILIDTEQIRS